MNCAENTLIWFPDTPSHTLCVPGGTSVTSDLIAACSDGAASSRPANPAADAAASDARPAAMPAINGTERRKPNYAPEAVASVVAPLGVIVKTTTNRMSGRITSKPCCRSPGQKDFGCFAAWSSSRLWNGRFMDAWRKCVVWPSFFLSVAYMTADAMSSFELRSATSCR